MNQRPKSKALGSQSSRLIKSKAVSEQKWLAERKKLLKKEKAFSKQRDELSRQRRALPWVKVEKTYVFDTPNGKATLADLFDGRSQLIVYHFMLGPGWEQGCKGCSFVSDHIDGTLAHLTHHDVSLVVVSRAPRREITSFKKRMGWRFPWVSSFGSDFNFDYHVSFTEQQMAKGRVDYNYTMRKSGSEELPGLSVFYKTENGDVFHTYSTYARGLDMLLGTYHYLDLTPFGRQERKGKGMDWVRHHDKYDDVAGAKS